MICLCTSRSSSFIFSPGSLILTTRVSHDADDGSVVPMPRYTSSDPTDCMYRISYSGRFLLSWGSALRRVASATSSSFHIPSLSLRASSATSYPLCSCAATVPAVTICVGVHAAPEALKRSSSAFCAFSKRLPRAEKSLSTILSIVLNPKYSIIRDVRKGLGYFFFSFFLITNITINTIYVWLFLFNTCNKNAKSKTTIKRFLLLHECINI